MRFAIVDKDTKKVVNCIIWEGAEFLPPRNHFVVRSDVCDHGDYWNEKANTFHTVLEDGRIVEKPEPERT